MTHRLALVPLCVCLFAGAAAADDPKFEFGKKEEVKAVEWKATAQAGAIYVTGNSRATTITAGANASRKAGADKLSIEGGVAYARSTVFVASDINGSGGLSEDEIQAIETTSTKSWLIKARYDRFLTEHNSLYAAARVLADEPAGKQLVGGAQAGYSRLLFKNPCNELVSEVGYDFSYENFVAPGDPVNIHSGRGFAGYTGKVRTDTEVAASGELLLNINRESTPTGTVKAFHDARFLGKAGLTTKLTGRVSFKVGFTLKFDNAPAPRPPFAGLAYEFNAKAEKLDTITEAQLVVTLL
ncbi:MAG TPA: DUF481 domain-containing protein [Kofleriaceae bacterium]|nr:DUF481 domain-containing protein [Kofleriaceae bacterium]